MKRKWWSMLLVTSGLSCCLVFLISCKKSAQDEYYERRLAEEDKAHEMAKISSAKMYINNLTTTLDVFSLDCDRFPTTAEGLQALIQQPGNVAGWKGPYLLNQTTVPLDPWKHAFRYRCPSQKGKAFDLWSDGPDGEDGTADDITN